MSESVISRSIDHVREFRAMRAYLANIFPADFANVQQP